jgi:opacity protein-like surface antigen
MRHVWIPLALLAWLAAPVLAEEATSTEQAFSVRGFGTLGYAQSSNADAEFLRDLSQPTGVTNVGGLQIDSILGLQVNYRANEALEMAAQAVSHQRYDNSFTPELTWAFLKYDLNPRLSARLGRIGTEFLMQSDSRMVGYSYLAARPAVNFYAGVPINYGDGADLHLSTPLADGVLKGSLYLGVARERLPTYEVNGSQIRAASLGYEKGPFQLRLIHAQSVLTNSIAGLQPLRTQLAGMGAAAAASALDMQDTLSVYRSVGLAYDDGSWQVQAALNHITHGTVLTENSRAGYLFVARRMGNLSPYVGYAWTQSSAKALDTGLTGMAGAMLNPAVAAVLQASHQDQQTSTIGLRWDFARNVDLKAQFDFVHGEPTSTLLYRKVQQGAWDGHTTVFSLAMDFVF